MSGVSMFFMAVSYFPNGSPRALRHG